MCLFTRYANNENPVVNILDPLIHKFEKRKSFLLIQNLMLTLPKAPAPSFWSLLHLNGGATLAVATAAEMQPKNM